MAVFAGNGFAFASWAARLPAVRDGLALTPGQVGLLLLALSVGAVTALPTTGAIIHLLGTARTVAGGAVLVILGLAMAGTGAGAVASAALTAAGLFAFGWGTSCWDVAMNVEGAEVERWVGRTIMPRFHASFSLGTVLGGATGAVAAAFGVPLTLHLLLVVAIVAAGLWVPFRCFLPQSAHQPDDAPRRPGEVLRAWTEPRTLLIGVVVLAMAFSEGAANDWLALALVDGYAVDNATGALGLVLFVGAQTVGRLFGSGVLDRFGRLRVLRVSVLMSAAGVALVALGGSLATAVAGAVVWGLGAALGFPVGMSAAADSAAQAAARVSVVASIGYTAFLAGPPLLGWLGDLVGVQHALAAVAVLMLPVLLALPAVRRPAAAPVSS